MALFCHLLTVKRSLKIDIFHNYTVEIDCGIEKGVSIFIFMSAVSYSCATIDIQPVYTWPSLSENRNMRIFYGVH